MLVIGDEKSFIEYEEYVIQRLQQFFRSVEDLREVLVIPSCALIEDEIYQETLRTFHLSPNASIWTNSDCINHFFSRCESLLKLLESEARRKASWKKVFDSHAKNGAELIRVIQQSEDDFKSMKPKPSSTSSAQQKPASVPKAPKAAGPPKAPAAPKAAGKAKATKKTKQPAVGVDTFPAVDTEIANALPLPFEDPILMDADDNEWGFDFKSESNPEIKDIQLGDYDWK